MPLPPFKDIRDPDEKRRELVWIALSFIVILACWLSVVLFFGYRPLALGMTYDEMVLLAGFALLVLCAIAYLAAREREQRATNKALVRQLNGAVSNLDARVGQLNELCETSAELAGALDLHQIGECVVPGVLQAMEAESAYLVMVDLSSDRIIYEHCEPTAAALTGVSRLDADMMSALPRNLTPYDTTNVLLQLRADGQGIRAVIAFKEGIAGVLGAVRATGSVLFTAEDNRILTTLANMSAKAIESAYLHNELRENYLATVRSLVCSLHERDDYTATHGQRVAALAARLAERLDLGEAALRDIEIFGPLHDVGKIGIRDDILMKTGPLSEQERAICREHCITGERILRPLKPGKAALAMIRNHHEAWNGSGYPDGLAGKAIPLLARVLHVADVFDAMISNRPYQGSLSEQEVLAHFRQYAGYLYDPDAVAVLCAAISEGPVTTAEEMESPDELETTPLVA